MFEHYADMQCVPNITMRARREALGLTLAKLASLADLTLGQVWKIEQGRVRPQVDSARRIARALDSTVEAIWGDDEQQQASA